MWQCVSFDKQLGLHMLP